MEARIESRLTKSQRRAFDLARKAAQDVLRRKFRLLNLVRDASRKLINNEPSLKRVREDLRVLMRLARSWARREYRALPWKSILYAVAALVYFVNPVDLIPDALVGIGFVDDMAVVAAVVRAIRDDLEQFMAWEGDTPALDVGEDA